MKTLIKNTLKPLRWGGVIKPASLKGYKVPLWLRGRVNDREFSRYANIPGLIASGGINSDEISTIINVFFFFSFFFLMTLEERVKKASSTFFYHSCEHHHVSLDSNIFNNPFDGAFDDKRCWYAFGDKIIKDLDDLFLSVFDLSVYK